MKKWTNLTWEQIHELPIEEFHKLALQQKELFPDLLGICNEETIIESFYDYYDRKIGAWENGKIV